MKESGETTPGESEITAGVTQSFETVLKKGIYRQMHKKNLVSDSQIKELLKISSFLNPPFIRMLFFYNRQTKPFILNLTNLYINYNLPDYIKSIINTTKRLQIILHFLSDLDIAE